MLLIPVSKYLFKTSNKNPEMMPIDFVLFFFLVDFKEAFAHGMLRHIDKVHAFGSGNV